MCLPEATWDLLVMGFGGIRASPSTPGSLGPHPQKPTRREKYSLPWEAPSPEVASVSVREKGGGGGKRKEEGEKREGGGREGRGERMNEKEVGTLGQWQGW